MTPKPIPRLSEEEISNLALRIVRGEVYVTANGETMAQVWMVLFTFMDPSDFDLAAVGAMWEEIAKQMPRSMNGLPLFSSGHFVHHHDVPSLREAVERKQRALEEA